MKTFAQFLLENNTSRTVKLSLNYSLSDAEMVKLESDLEDANELYDYYPRDISKLAGPSAEITVAQPIADFVINHLRKRKSTIIWIDDKKVSDTWSKTSFDVDSFPLKEDAEKDHRDWEDRLRIYLRLKDRVEKGSGNPNDDLIKRAEVAYEKARIALVKARKTTYIPGQLSAPGEWGSRIHEKPSRQVTMMKTNPETGRVSFSDIK